MSTINQRCFLEYFKCPQRERRPKLKLCPQRQGMVLRVAIRTPRKPNSARRPVVKVLLSTKLHAVVHIPGSGHNLARSSEVLVCGVGARDLPVVNYSCLRGVYSFAPLAHKKKRRSVYGAKKPRSEKTFVRRKERQYLNVTVSIYTK